MATPQVGEVVNAVGDLNAEKLVFSDNKTGGLLEGEDKKPPSDTSIDPKDFYWDQILFYLVSAILGLSFLDISVEFFRGSVVQCFIPDGPTRDQVAYLNNYCYGSLPDSQYYLIFILISALLIIAPHYMWNSYFGAHFDFFFDLVRKLDRLRDTKTGEYNPLNFELVKKLEKKFCKFNTWIFRLYKLKLLSQLVISIVILLANWFYFSSDDFNETFSCPANDVYLNSSTWPLEGNVSCVYNSLNLLWFLRMAAFGLVSASILFIIIGIVWCFIRHSNELGAKEIAEFCDVSCLLPEEHNFPSIRNVIKQIFWCRKHRDLPPRKEKEIELKENRTEEEIEEEIEVESYSVFCGCFEAFTQLFYPRISNDLDFLLMKLYFADSGHGQVFKDVQVYKEIKEKTCKDQELLYLLKRVQGDLTNKKLDRITARIDRQFQRLEEGLAESSEDEEEEESEEWERFGDLKRFFFESGLERAGPGTNCEETLYKSFENKMGVELGDWSHSALRSVLYGFLNFAPGNKLSLDISFGTSTGYSLVLARAFTQVATFHFNKYYQNTEELRRVKCYQAGYRTITYQDDIFSQEGRNITSSEEPITQLFRETQEGRSIDLIMIGPITDRSKIVTANLLIQKLYDRMQYFKDNAILIAVRPLMIGSKPRTEHFVQYKPPEGIFKDINDEVETKLTASGINIYTVTSSGNVTLVTPTQTINDALPSHTNGTPRSVLRRRSTVSSTTGRNRRGSPRTLMRDKSLIENQQKILPRGIVVQCNDLECVFEFKLYRYCGRYKANKTPAPSPKQQLVDVSSPSGEFQVVESDLQSPVQPTDLQSPLQPTTSNLSLADHLSITTDNSRSSQSLVDTQPIATPTNEVVLPNNEEHDNLTYPLVPIRRLSSESLDDNQVAYQRGDSQKQ